MLVLPLLLPLLQKVLQLAAAAAATAAAATAAKMPRRPGVLRWLRALRWLGFCDR